VRFLFFKGRIKTRDVYTAFHELHLHRDEAYFIAVDFPDKTSNLLYQSVMEENEKEKENMEQIADNILEKLLMEKHIQDLEDNVNQSHNRRDKHAFHTYQKQLKNWKKV